MLAALGTLIAAGLAAWMRGCTLVGRTRLTRSCHNHRAAAPLVRLKTRPH